MIKRALIVLLLLACNEYVQGQKFEVSRLWEPWTPQRPFETSLDERRINIVILGDGYLESQLPEFRIDAGNMMSDLFNTSPFKEYRNYFTVNAISVPSNEEGAADDPSALIDNYFGSTFNYSGVRRILYSTRTEKIEAVLANNFPLHHIVIMLVNSSEYGGSGGSIATASIHDRSSDIAIHEIGHSFSGLADEYWPGYGREAPNMTTESSPANVKWRNWLGESGVGIVPYAEDPAWYKPGYDCKMLALASDFCPVCRERFVTLFREIVSPVEWYDTMKFRTNDGKEAISFWVDVVSHDMGPAVEWFVDSKRVPIWNTLFDFVIEDYAPGPHVVEAFVYDLTMFDRSESINTTIVTWNVGTEGITSEVRREPRGWDLGPVTGIDDEPVPAIHVFPNPTAGEVIVEYDAVAADALQISLLNANGTFLKTVTTREVDLSGYAPGIYFLIVTTASSSQSVKVIRR